MRKLPLYCLLAAISFIVICFLPSFTVKILLAGLALSITILLLAIMTQQIVVKYIFITLFSLALPLTIFEGYSHILLQKYTITGPTLKTVELDGKPLSKPHPRVGYKLLPNETFKVRASRGDNIIYDVTYTSDADGRRITPQHPNAKTAVVLLGCSFTFGHGLNDKDTMPWKLGEILGDEYQVYNLGYSGYGTHNMLGIIEGDLPDLSKYDKIQTFFISIEDHPRRIAGASNWNANSPYYEVVDGKAVFTSTFGQLPPLPWEDSSLSWIKESAIYRFYRKPISEFFSTVNSEEKRLNLFRALVLTGAELLQQRYPQNTSELLVWPAVSHSPFAEKIQFMNKDIPTLDMEAWFPDFSNNIDKYSIVGDGHPNPLNTDIVATKLAEHIRKQNQE